MPTTESLAALVTDKRQIEMRSFPVPQVSPADAILKVELYGICGSDYHYYTEGEHWPYQLPPQILGHKVVGRIDKIGHEAARKWRVREGDLVIVESAITCGRCRYCLTVLALTNPKIFARRFPLSARAAHNRHSC